jgi:hypothetical protein
MRPLCPIRWALNQPDFFGPILAGDSFRNWRTMAIAICGEEIDDDERSVFASLTGRPQEPLERVDEAWAIVGRRGGKTRAVATLAAYFSCLCDHSDALAPGERGVLPIMSASIWQASKALQYLDGVFATVPALRDMIVSRWRHDLAQQWRRH